MVSEQWWQVQEVSTRQVSTGVEGQNEQSKTKTKCEKRYNFLEYNFTGIQDCWRTILNEGVQGLQRSCSGNCGSGFTVRVQEILTKTLPGKTSEDICEDIWSSELQIVNRGLVLRRLTANFVD